MNISYPTMWWKVCASLGSTSGVGLIVKMGAGMLLSSHAPLVFVMSLLAAEEAPMKSGSSILVSTAATWPGLSYSRSTTGNSAANLGWLSGSVFSRKSR